MKFEIRTPKNAAQVMAARWDLTLQDRLIETGRSVVYKATGPTGQVVLKLYKKIGSSGEGAAIPFLRNLEPGIGVKLHRVSTFRTAVLMEWLEGPTLDKLIVGDDDTQATAHLAHVAGGVMRSEIKYPSLYRRIAPRIHKDFKRCLANDAAGAPDSNLSRAAALLDDLMKSTRQERVMHGDLRFENVILTPDGPRLIDPKGFVADPAFEFSRSLAPSSLETSVQDFHACIQRRASVMAPAIDATPLRLIQWGAVVAAHKQFRGMGNAYNPQQRRPYIQAYLDLAKDDGHTARP